MIIGKCSYRFDTVSDLRCTCTNRRLFLLVPLNMHGSVEERSTGAGPGRFVTSHNLELASKVVNT
jgi:hypothetical protein